MTRRREEWIDLLGFLSRQPVIPALGASVVEQPQWLVGSQEAEVEAYCARRGWNWHVAHVQDDYVLLWRDGREDLDEPRLMSCLADREELFKEMAV